MDAAGYRAWLVDSCFNTIEMSYFIGQTLVAVGILDLGKHSASSVYFYFDPSDEVSRLSPGVYSALQEVAFCSNSGRSHLYLGLYVSDCRALNYKTSYSPHELFYDGDWRKPKASTIS